ERARSLALMRQLASWSFKEGGLHEQLVQFEEAVASYETASSKVYPEDLVIASVVGGLKEPLQSQVQLRMTSTTTYPEIRSWILQYEAVNTPWSTTLSSRGGGGSSHGGPQPMEVDQIWAKGKDGKGKKGDPKGKGKDGKGKKGDKGNGKYGQPSGWKQQPGQWTQQGQWSQPGGWKQQPGQWNQQGQWGTKGGGGYKQQQGGQSKGGKGKGKGQCHVCGQTGHWKWECPFKGKGKGVNQVDASSSSASTAPSATSTSTAPSSATAFNNKDKAGGYGVNRVEVSLGTPPGCGVTQLFDISELEDGEDFNNFSLEPAEVMMIRASKPSWLDTLDEDWGVEAAPLAASQGPEEFAMDASDWDGDWTVPWYEPNTQEEVIVSIRAVRAHGREVEVVVDSGADISVAPCAFADLGSPGTPAAVTMHDAQGKEIVELGNRVLDIEVRSLEGETVTIREKFAVANVGSLILSLGRLLRWGWELGHEGGGPVIKRDGRNTLTMLGIVSLISASCCQPAAEAATVNAASVFDDFGALPPEAEELVARPGWHILGSGLPFLVAHRTETMHWEQNLWSSEDWSWAAVFVRAEPATRLPRAGDLWYQVAALQTNTLEAIPETVSDFNDELAGPRDVCVLFHVSELPKDLLSRPQEFFKESRDDNGNMDIAVPLGEVEGGAGAMPEEVVAAERELAEEEPDGEVMDGATLAFETPLRDLRSLCQRQGLATSGSKAKVLRRLKQHYEVLERQLAGQLAHKLFMEEDRPPDLPRASPHQHQSNQKGEAQEEADDGIPLFQIDYAYTFTKKRAEDDGDEEREQSEEQQVDPVDYQDQYGLTLVGAEKQTGWCIAIPVLQKGSAALRRVVEQLTRYTMQVCPAGPVIFQGDPEASIKQIVNAVAACRSKLGLETQTRFIPRASRQSNGMVEKMVQTVRNGGRTLRHKGDLQWRRGVYVGQNERNAASILLTPDGAHEARSIRRLPVEEQWNGEFVVSAKGLPWDYQGVKKRKRPLYTSARPALLPDTASLEELAKEEARVAMDTSTARGGEGGLFPPGFAGVREVTGDIGPEELSGFSAWQDEVATFGGELEFEHGGSGEEWAPDWDPDAERPPDLQGEDLEQVDRAADLTELTRLLQMGVLRKPGETEDVRQYTHLTTKVVRDWRKRPGWTRRSRLVAREFRSNAPWSEEMFAPASSLGVVHSFLIWAISAGLEVVSLDIKDAYLQVPQPAPAIITVDARIFSKDATGEVTYVLERLLPGQRIGASSWYNFARDLLTEAGMENYVKEPTLFRGNNTKERSGMILHADDGLLASSAKERERILGVLRSRVVLQVTNPLLRPGDEIEFLKRRYVYSEEGIVVFPSNRYAEALFEGVGKGAKPRDTPADNSFLEKDTSRELEETEARKYREAVGRLLYLSHSRGDLQFATCILASKMAQPTAMSWRWLQRVIGYLKKVPMVGIVLKPASPDACFGYGGKPSSLGPGAKVVVESITDADWAGDKQTRRSRTSIQIFVAGSMVASFVRSQRSIALSSGESEFIALVGGSSEALYIADCLRFLVEAEGLEIEVRSRSDSAACRGITQRVGCGRVRHLDASLLWVQMAVKAKKLVIGTVAGSLNPSDIGTKPLAGPRLRELMFLMGGRTVDMEPYGEQDHNEACAKRGMAKAFKEIRDSSSTGVSIQHVKRYLPLLVLLCQAGQVEGLSLAGPLLAMVDSELVSLVMTTVFLGSFFVAMFLGVPVGLFWVLAKVCCWQRRERYGVYVEVGVQANLGMSKKEEIFQQEYVQRVTELRGQLSEKCDEVREFEQLVKRLRGDIRALERELVTTRANTRLPETVVAGVDFSVSAHMPVD
ncbi:unnamed protein product, partial [Symbiodinium necroappetens]